ncbi:unnamed protein product [Caenorhabditis angaria]|uniref:C2H2-type domain-containing protein n=1 Tax=Caenorhabditis angaria TaxID=860376 RepID=A0A9P1IZ27_9PELO|nr:unnamed protein product [Caenorhabditis angaria]
MMSVSVNTSTVPQENNLVSVMEVLNKQMFEPITRALQNKASSAQLSDDTMSEFQSTLSSMTNALLCKFETSFNNSSPNRSEVERETPDKITSLKSEASVSPSEVDTNTVAAATAHNNASTAAAVKEMLPRRKNKRSLEDMVQKLSGEKQLEAELNAAKRTPPLPTTNMIFPASVLTPMTRLMNPAIAPMVPHMYLNNLLHSPFTNYLANLGLHQFPTPDFKKTELSSSEDGRQTPEEDIKIDVDSDDLEASPSPSSGNGDIAYDAAENIRDTTSDIGAIENDAEKPFACEHSNCYKRFANKFLLKKHRFIHTGLRPHQCPFCSKKFNRKDNLLRHKKTHTQNGATPTIVNPVTNVSFESATPKAKAAKQSAKVANRETAPFTMANIGIDNFRFHLENYFQLAKLTNPTFFKKEETI